MIPNAAPAQTNISAETESTRSAGDVPQTATTAQPPPTVEITSEANAGSEEMNGNGKRPRGEAAGPVMTGATSDGGKDGPGRKKKKKKGNKEGES